MEVNDFGRVGFRVLFGLLSETALNARGKLLDELPDRDPHKN